MKKEILAQFGQPDLILFGFLLFFGCFLAVLIGIVFSSKTNYFEKQAQIPFADGRDSDER